jgi:hypothetical protein
MTNDDKTRLTLVMPSDLRNSLGRIKQLTGKSLTDQLIEGAWMAEKEFMKKVDAQHQVRQRVMNVVR